MFCEKKCSQKFCKIHRKAPVLEPQTCNFIKKETHVFSCEFCEIYKINFFTEHLLAAASYKYYLCTVFMLAEFVLFQNCKSFQVNTEPYVNDIQSSQTNSRDLLSDLNCVFVATNNQMNSSTQDFRFYRFYCIYFFLFKN